VTCLTACCKTRDLLQHGEIGCAGVCVCGCVERVGQQAAAKLLPLPVGTSLHGPPLHHLSLVLTPLHCGHLATWPTAAPPRSSACRCLATSYLPFPMPAPSWVAAWFVALGFSIRVPSASQGHGNARWPKVGGHDAPPGSSGHRWAASALPGGLAAAPSLCPHRRAVARSMQCGLATCTSCCCVQVHAELVMEALPLLDGAQHTLAAGVTSSLHSQNARASASVQNFEEVSAYVSGAAGIACPLHAQDPSASI